MREFQVIDEELFNKIREDYKQKSFDFLRKKYEMADHLLKSILSAQTYEEFCEDKTV